MTPRLLIILCEGRTEKLYFDIVIRRKRIYRVKTIISEKHRAHKTLIEHCAKARVSHAKDFDFDEAEIETWAVCDCDDWKDGYPKLLKYANENHVNLAYSNPQFETYLIQHFQLSKTTKKKGELEKELSTYLGKKYNKADLSWFDEMIDTEPKKLEIAIKNADNFNKHTKIPFLTVQNLTKRLLDFTL